MMRLLRAASVLPVAALLLIAWLCPPVSAGTIRDDRDPQAFRDLAANARYASAGLLRINRNTPDAFTGSGVLIGDRWVLTAAHLLEGTTDMALSVGGQEVEAEGWVAHSRFDGDFRKGYDLGLIRLAQPVTGVAPAGLYRTKKEQGMLATFAGFGRTGTGTAGGQPLDQVDFLGRAGTNTIDGTVDLKLGFGRYKDRLGGARVFVVDFDNPANPADNSTGTPQPTELEYLIAQGDSGGPVFLDDPRNPTGAPLVAGIHSFGEFRDAADDSDYGDITGHTRVSLYRSWITKTMKRGDMGRSIPDFVTASASSARELPVSASVPEPASALLLALGAGLCALRRGRR